MKNLYLAALGLIAAISSFPALADDVPACTTTESGDFVIDTVTGDSFRWDGTGICRHVGRGDSIKLMVTSLMPSKSSEKYEKVFHVKLDFEVLETFSGGGNTTHFPSYIELWTTCRTKPGDRCRVEFKGTTLLSIHRTGPPPVVRPEVSHETF